MFVLSCIFSAFRPCKVSALTSKQLSAKCCSNVAVLRCAAKTETVQSLMEALVRTEYLVSVASRTKFFVTTVDGWESLVAHTKITILVVLGVLDLSLFEIEIKQIHPINASVALMQKPVN